MYCSKMDTAKWTQTPYVGSSAYSEDTYGRCLVTLHYIYNFDLAIYQLLQIDPGSGVVVNG